MVEHPGQGHESVGLVPGAGSEDRADEAAHLADHAQGGGDVPQHAAAAEPHHPDSERGGREDHDRRGADVLPAGHL